jgi:hypothetical protein
VRQFGEGRVATKPVIPEKQRGFPLADWEKSGGWTREGTTLISPRISDRRQDLDAVDLLNSKRLATLSDFQFTPD